MRAHVASCSSQVRAFGFSRLQSSNKPSPSGEGISLTTRSLRLLKGRARAVPSGADAVQVVGIDDWGLAERPPTLRHHHGGFEVGSCRRCVATADGGQPRALVSVFSRKGP